MTGPLEKIEGAAIEEGIKAARRVLVLQYPDDEYIPLIIALPVHRSLVKAARNGDPAADAAIRESLVQVIQSVAWPDA